MSERPEQPLGVDSTPVGPWSRAERGPRGTRLVPADPPVDGSPPPVADLAVRAVAEREVHGVEVVADGRLALAIGDAAYSIRVPAMSVVHTRTPQGLDAIGGASVANAGLLHGDDGWRVVVLPSLGDVATDLGDGPLALRPDGREIAVAVDGGVERFDLSSGETLARHDGTPAALAYAGDGSLLVAAGAAIGEPGTPAAEGSPVVELRAATRAWRAVARHEDGGVSIWALEPEGARRLAEAASPFGAAAAVNISPDGEWVGISSADPAAVAIARAEDGAPARTFEGARAVGLLADGALVLGGEWGVAYMRPTEDSQ